MGFMFRLEGENLQVDYNKSLFFSNHSHPVIVIYEWTLKWSNWTEIIYQKHIKVWVQFVFLKKEVLVRALVWFKLKCKIYAARSAPDEFQPLTDRYRHNKILLASGKVELILGQLEKYYNYMYIYKKQTTF